MRGSMFFYSVRIPDSFFRVVLEGRYHKKFERDTKKMYNTRKSKIKRTAPFSSRAVSPLLSLSLSLSIFFSFRACQ